MIPQARNTALAYLGIAVLLLVVTVVLPASGVWERRGLPVVHETIREASVIEVTPGDDPTSPSGVIRQQRVVVEVDGERFTIERAYQDGGVDAFVVENGDTVLLGQVEGGQGMITQIKDHSRRVPV